MPRRGQTSVLTRAPISIGRVFPDATFLQPAFPSLLTALSIKKAQKPLEREANYGRPRSPRQPRAAAEGTHLVELPAHLLGLELLQEVPVLDGVQGHDLRASPLPVIPDRRTPPPETHTVTPFDLDSGFVISCFILNVSFYTVLIFDHRK